MILMIVQFLIILFALYVGSRFGSIALGAIAGIALAVFVFVFGMQPGSPPTTVIYIIIAAVTCAGVLQASGGMDFLVQITEKFLRNNPSRITFYAPFCTFFLTVLVGTGHVVYTLMPIIADIALKKGIRPERPCAVASVASQAGIACSPIAAAVVAFYTMTVAHGVDVSILGILMVTMPCTMLGIFVAALYSSKRGLELDQDPDFQERISTPEKRAYVYGENENRTTLHEEISDKAKLSVYMFLGAIGLIVFFASFQGLLPHFGEPGNEKPMSMALVIQVVMLCIAGLILIVCKADPKKVVSGSVWQAGMVAVVVIYGIAWLSDTFFLAYKTDLMNSLSGMVKTYPWAIGFVIFGVSVLTNSQGATVTALIPLAYGLGIPFYVLCGVFPAVYGYFFIPTYPSDVATMNFDRSGTTKIGKFLLNHSFMIPGLLMIGVACVSGYFFAGLIYG